MSSNFRMTKPTKLYARQSSAYLPGKIDARNGGIYSSASSISDVDSGGHVKLELWRDLTDGANGGTWEKLHKYVDTPAKAWGAGQTPCASVVDPAQIMTGPNLSVFTRDDSVSDVRYKKWSIREIAPQ